MRLRRLLLAVLALQIGCRGSEQPSIESNQPRAAVAALHALAGAYYRGDGLGYNIDLDLRADGSYDAEWRGCLGVYGTASGSWSSDGVQVVLSPSNETDMMQGHLRQLDIEQHEGRSILLHSKDRGFYDRHGASPYSCFQRTEAVK